jgi:hypothetical protein
VLGISLRRHGIDNDLLAGHHRELGSIRRDAGARARRGNHYVSIAFHQVLLAIVERGQRHIAQHVVERPDEGRRVRALEIFLDRCDENAVKVLRLPEVNSPYPVCL